MFCQYVSIPSPWLLRTISSTNILICLFYKLKKNNNEYVFFSKEALTNPVANTLISSGFISTMLSIFTAWIRVNPAIKMLNSWQRIELKFHKIFVRTLNIQNLRTEIRKLSLTFFKIPLMLIVLVGSAQFLKIKLSGLSEILNLFFRFISFLVSMTLALASQLYFFMICHIVSRIYDKVHEQILAFISSTKPLDSKIITKWKSMLLLLGEQMKHIGDFISPVDIVHIIVRIINITISVYTILQWFGGSQANVSQGKDELTSGLVISMTDVLWMAWCSLLTNLGTMALEVYFAEKIYKAVIFFYGQI